jgi:hypothetical protein
MGKKKVDQQKTRKESIRRLADELKKENWEVKANAEGTEKPPKIGIFTPDILATKGDLKRICQVLTEKAFRGDKQRYIEFKAYCDEYDFHFYVIDKDGKRRQIDPIDLGKKYS